MTSRNERDIQQWKREIQENLDNIVNLYADEVADLESENNTLTDQLTEAREEIERLKSQDDQIIR